MPPRRGDAWWRRSRCVTARAGRTARRSPRTTCAWRSMTIAPRRRMADRVERVERLDDRTIRFTYRAGERWELYPLVARVLPVHILANASAEKRAQYAREPIHAGPFAVAAWIPGFGMTLSAFPRYVGGAPALGRIEVRRAADIARERAQGHAE